jgi:coatomer subunit beta
MLCKCTNLCLVGTEEQVHVTKQLIDKSQFIAVNLYAKSIFDEDALVNVSIEKEADGRLAGTVRIRARNQGIALSLGDKVNQIQKDQLRGA